MRSIFIIAEELVDRQTILKDPKTGEYGQDDVIFNLIDELKRYLKLQEEH
jgi:hypothetical protein